jgi:hypothetical protein
MIKRVRPSTNKLEVIEKMDSSSYLRSGEESWQGAFDNLVQRFAELDPAVIAEHLRQNAGHAGCAAKALRKVTPAMVSQAKCEEIAPTRDASKDASQEMRPTKERFASVKSTGETKLSMAPPVQDVATDTQVETERPIRTPVDSKMLFVAALQGDVQDMTRLIADGADLNVRYTGRPHREQPDKIIEATPLHFVVTMGMATVAEALLRHGADVEAKMERSLGKGKPPAEHYAEMTPLHLAAMEGHTNIVEMLLDCGADRNALMYLTEQTGGSHKERTFTALEIAEEMATKGHMRESVIALLSAPI